MLWKVVFRNLHGCWSSIGSITLYPSMRNCVNCGKEISQLALLSSLLSHTDPTIEDASVINDNSLSILENDILMENWLFWWKSLRRNGGSRTNTIKEKFQKSASNSEKVLLLTLAPESWDRRRLAKEFGQKILPWWWE